jgi:hypothetical protein
MSKLLSLATTITMLVSPAFMAAAARGAIPQAQHAAVWQYSIPLEVKTERRAYLWIPPHCTHVRAVLFGLQNMLERSMFEDPIIRASADKTDLAIVLVSPGAWPDKSVVTKPSLESTQPANAISGVQDVLDRLAKESGYTEIRNAPVILTGHSAASPFIWSLARVWRERIVALLPYKGYPVPEVIDGIPTLKVEQEWAEWGENWGEVWRKEMQQAVGKVKLARSPLFGEFVDIGAGHFDWHREAAPVIAMFLEKAMAARVPKHRDVATELLTTIGADAGVLVDVKTLGTPGFAAVPYLEWQRTKDEALWYFDKEMAESVNRFMQAGLAKKPEMLDFYAEGIPAPLLKNGFASLEPTFLTDGVRFRLHAEMLTTSPNPRMDSGHPLGHANNVIKFRVSSGALEQTGADTFKVAARSGGLRRQGQPWEPWIMAYQEGDKQYRSTDRPAHILINIKNTTGIPQSLTFDSLPNVRTGTRTISLKASASSGFPVQFFVESGPAIISNNCILFTPIPPRSSYPVRVIVSAFQWGRVGTNPVQSAGPITREFFVEQ